MPYAIEMTFDQPTEAAVRALWRDLAVSGVVSHAQVAGATPHITQAVCDELDLEGAVGRLEALAAGRSPLPIRLEGISLFAASPQVLYLAPVVTRDLLGLHEQAHAALAAAMDGAWERYLPGAWIPHCTLSEGLTPATLPVALTVCRAARLPLAGALAAVAVVAIRPIRLLHTLAFGHGHVASV